MTTTDLPAPVDTCACALVGHYAAGPHHEASCPMWRERYELDALDYRGLFHGMPLNVATGEGIER